MIASHWNPWYGVLLLSALVVLLLALLRLYQILARPDPEFVRKLFHLGGGLLGLSMPWLFQEMAPVVALAAATTALFLALRTVTFLREGPGQVLAAVKRKTIGEFCFVASFCLLFWLSRGDKLLYGVPLLVLAFADTFAALIGEQYGKHPYHAWRDRKSMEGSVAFFFAAFFCVHVPVLLLTDTPRLESLLIAVNIAVMVMMAEAAAWYGLDNLIISLFSFALLKMFLPMPAIELLQHLAFLVALSLFIRFWRRRTTLADDALFGVSLWGYMVWALADWRWFIPPFFLIVTYTAITRSTPRDHIRIFNFPVALANIAGGLLWLLLYQSSPQSVYFYPSTAAYAANLAIIALVRHHHAVPDARRLHALLVNTGKGMLLLLPSILLMDGCCIAAAVNILGCTLSVLLATALFQRVQPDLARYPIDTARWWRQAIITTTASLFALLPHALLVTL